MSAARGSAMSGGEGAVEQMWLSQPDPVGAWLDVLMGLVRVGASEKRAIRDELDSHLRDRVRDLMLTGLHESNATREAIAELGDAAELAARYARAAKSPARRRIAMHVGLFGMAGAALVTSMVAIQQPGRDGPGPAALAYQPQEQVAPEQATKTIGKVEMRDMPLEQVLEFAASSAGLSLSMTEAGYDRLGVMADSPVTVVLKEATLGRLLDAVSAQLSEGGAEHLAFRVENGTLRIASAHDFDMEERVLVTIDVSGPMDRGIDGEEIKQLAMEFIEPDAWVDNGGDLGQMNIVGDRMFLKAPPRMVEGVRWIVGQLAAPAQVQSRAGAAGALGADEYVRVFKLKNTSAATILAAVEPIYAAVAERTDPEARRLSFTADPANPVIVVRGPKRLVEEACEVMTQMDDPRGGEASAQVGPVQSEDVSAPLDSRMIPLKNTPAPQMAEVLRAAGTVSERLRNGPRERAIAVDASTNALWVRSTESQIDAIEEIVGALDTDGPIDDRAISESRTMKLERARAAEVRRVLGLALNANERMKQCPVTRIFEVDASENTLTVTATPGQVDAIGRMVVAMDR